LNDSGENSLMKSLCTIQINYSDSGFYLKELHTTASEDLNRCWNAHHGPALLLQICFGGRSSRTNVPIPQEYLSGPAVDRGCPAWQNARLWSVLLSATLILSIALP